jgi:DNA-binding NarL/FixJ family response regulator
MADPEVRVLVVEDHPLYRQAVSSLVDGMTGWRVVGAHGEAESALDQAPEADLVVLDLGLPGMDGIEATSRFKERHPQLAVVVLTMSEEPAVLAAAIRAGAQGYLVKGSEPDDIERALRSVARGQAVFGEQVAVALLAQAGRRTPRLAATAFPGLTDREREVLDLMAEGRANADIAQALFLSPKTARNHVSSVLTKLGCTRAEAIARARDVGLGRTSPER